jgi:tRNA (cytosine34-C5)-methyltransferase
MLVHHTKRLASPSIVVTNNPAQTYPRLPMRLDRILADVPCTGDGTLRKNPDLWRRWLPAMGPGLHQLQVRIAYRAAQMLAEGGRMVYSTCSLNPVEDEAVVMELLRQTGGAMELIDVSNVLPTLKYAPGISTWRMLDRDNQWYSSFSDVPANARNRLKASCFQPTEEEAKTANLHYCLRLLPHHQNTGGFFIAVLHKKSKLPPLPAPTRTPRTTTPTTSTTETTTTPAPTTSTPTPTPAPAPTEDEDAPLPADDEASTEPPTKKRKEGEKEDDGVGELMVAADDGDAPAEPKGKKRKERKWVEDPFLPLTPQMQETMKNLQDFYGLANLPLHQIFTRSQKNHKLYFVTESIAELINKLQSDPSQHSGLTIVNSGVKLFNKHETSLHGYRVCQESIQWIMPLMTKRRVTITHADLILMLTHPQIYPNNLSKPAEAEMNKLDQGCVVFVVDSASDVPSAGMSFVAWFGKRSIHLLIKKKELTSLKNLFVPKETTPSTETTTETSTSSENTTSSTPAASATTTTSMDTA